MTAWVLIAMLSAGPMDSYTTLTMQEFTSQAACERAMVFIKGGERRIRRITCIPKGDTPHDR